jgi:peptidylprolyl isomerase
MKKLAFLFLFLSLAFASCQNKYPDLEKGVYAEFVTNKGTFVAKLFNEQTPLTVANFVSLSEGTNTMVDSVYNGKPFYNGLTFHRIIKDFMIQGGDPKGDGSGSPGYRFPDEFVDTLQHNKKGILSMANSGPGTNGSQFFITLKETPWLNGKHTIFGEIVIGQDVVDSLGNVATSKPGDKPVDPVILEKVNIINTSGEKVVSFTEEMEKMEMVKKEQEARVALVAEKVAAQLEEIKAMAEVLPSGVRIYFNKKGSGVKPNEGSKILMNYAGYLSNGQLFDSNIREKEERFEMLNPAKVAANAYTPVESDYSTSARLIPGFREGLLMMGVGDSITLFVPASLGYGEQGAGDVIPPNSDLIFELEIVEIVK